MEAEKCAKIAKEAVPVGARAWRGAAGGLQLQGPPAIGALSHCFFFGWEGSPKINRTKVGTLILSSQIWT